MTNYETLGRKTALSAERLAKHHELAALGREIGRMAMDFRLSSSPPPPSARVAEVQSLVARCAVLAAEIETIDRDLRDL